MDTLDIYQIENFAWMNPLTLFRMGGIMKGPFVAMTTIL